MRRLVVLAALALCAAPLCAGSPRVMQPEPAAPIRASVVDRLQFGIMGLPIHVDRREPTDGVLHGLDRDAVLVDALSGPISGEAMGPCQPTQSVQGLLLGKAGGGTYVLAWQASTDPCVEGYVILGSAVPTPRGTFTEQQQVSGAATNTTTIPLAVTYITILGTSGSGDGPW